MCHASMANREIHRCNSCDDWWPHKISQHHLPGHIKNNNLYKTIVGTQLTALSLTDISWYIHTFSPPVSTWIGNPPWMPWLHMKLSLKHTLKGFAGGQRLGGVGPPATGVVRHPGTLVKVEKTCVGKEKTWNFLEETNQRSIKQLHAMSCRIIIEDVFSLKCVTCFFKERSDRKTFCREPRLVSFGWKTSLVLSPGCFHLGFIQGSKLKRHDSIKNTPEIHVQNRHIEQ